MLRNKIHNFVKAPLSNKIAILRHHYWCARTRLFYRFMFKNIGRRSVVFRPMFILNADCIEIGEHVTIRDGVRLEVVRDTYGGTPSLTIGANTHIEQNVHIVCHSRVAIGCNVTIAASCAVVDVTHPYTDISIPNIGDKIAEDSSYVEIGDGAFIGYGAVILPNVRVGLRAVVGANSVVTKDVPDFTIVGGVPARVIGSIREI